MYSQRWAQLLFSLIGSETCLEAQGALNTVGGELLASDSVKEFYPLANEIAQFLCLRVGHSDCGLYLLIETFPFQ